MSILSAVALLGSLAAVANAHGTVQGIVAADTYYTGYNPSFQYQATPPTLIAWSVPKDQDNGFVSDYTSTDIACHKSATPGGTSAPVNGGDKVTFDWTTWPESHKGPVITYLAKCDGECEKADTASLKWFKIAEAGLIDGSASPGKWASDDLIANNQSSTVTIPDSIASGNYVARHEIIALHSAGEAGGAQNYPQCINLKVTSSGSDEPEGVAATSLYTAQDKGILFNIYQTLDDYPIPGPALYKGASSGSSAPAKTSAAASSAVSSAAATTSAVATNKAAVSTPASSAAAATSTASSSTPSKSIPDGTTIEDLLNWVQVLFDENKSASGSKAKRAHARDILRAMRA